MASKRPIFPTRTPVVPRHIGRADVRLARLWRRVSLVLAEFIGVRAEPPRCALSPLVSIFFTISTSLGQLPGGLIHPRIATTEQWRGPDSHRQ
jgi:hypothetical protein